ncbi:MAG: AAA family ATPase [Candidatus Coatesbacteria bacterium]|nr:AAA family ATPase [Candidatus Coatesbacteria bacterium]
MNNFIKSIRLRNILSFGPESEEIELQPLNVLIGPNASGKSNFIDAISLLRATSGDLAGAVRQMGGVEDLLWKGSGGLEPAQLEGLFYYPKSDMALRYGLNLAVNSHRLELVDEFVENEKPRTGYDRVFFFYRYENGLPVLNVRITDDGGAQDGDHRSRKLQREDLSPEQSVLSQRKDPDSYPEITYLSKRFSEIAFYTNWCTGRQSQVRQPGKNDLPTDFLLGDASNLALILSELDHRRETENLINKTLCDLYEGIERVTIRPSSSGSQLFIHEWGGRIIPSTRLSDGTLRYLFLLLLLCHPEPPPLICLEEPELGIHPDVIGKVADLLIEASKRTQLIVTTHSDILVSALSDTPGSVLVCEQGPKGTAIRRLEPSKLEEWLKEFYLGELWRKGVIGGNRW